MNENKNSEFTIIQNENNNDINIPVGDNSGIPETPGIESLTPPPASEVSSIPEATNVPLENVSTQEVPKSVETKTIQEESSEEVQPTYHVDGGNMHGTMADDEELIKEYIGKNAKKIMTRKFNFAGFSFLRYICSIER